MKKLIKLLLSSMLVLILTIFLLFGIKGNRNIENSNLVSGGEGDHWYHSSGCVLEKKTLS